jgi:hypothetical protein
MILFGSIGEVELEEENPGAEPEEEHAPPPAPLAAPESKRPKPTMAEVLSGKIPQKQALPPAAPEDSEQKPSIAPPEATPAKKTLREEQKRSTVPLGASPERPRRTLADLITESTPAADPQSEQRENAAPQPRNSRWKEDPQPVENTRATLEKASISSRSFLSEVVPEKPKKDAETLELAETTLVNSLISSSKRGEALQQRIKSLDKKPPARKFIMAILTFSPQNGACEWADPDNFGKALGVICRSTASQVEGIRAVVEFCSQRKFPPSSETNEPLVLELFKNLYDKEIFEEDAYMAWKNDSEDQSPGKAKALLQTADFFQWLETCGDEEEDDDEES